MWARRANLRRIAGRLRQVERGSVLIETALVIPMLLTLVFGIVGVVVNVAWNPLRIIHEGEFSAAPACGGITTAVLDRVVPQPRHAVAGHCEWWSLPNER